jgi:hypothetical protein
MGWTNVKFALQDHNYFAKEIRETKMEQTLVRASRLEVDYDKKRSTDAKEVQTLNRSEWGMEMADSVGVDNAARFRIRSVLAMSYVREAVVIRT